MAHILVAYKQFPAPDVGHAGGQSVYRFLEGLHGLGHRLTLVARVRDEERHHRPQVEALCKRVVTVPHHASLPGPRPLAVARSYLALRRAIVRTLREESPDALHVEFAQTAFVLLGVDYPRTSFRAHDVNWFLMEQQAEREAGLARRRSLALAWLFRRLEPPLYRRFDLVAAISEGDRRLLGPVCAPQAVHTLPLAPTFREEGEGGPAVPPGANVLFVGAMSRAYNVQAVEWFLDRVWPPVLAAVPEARFYVVGSSPPEAIRARHDGESVFVTGFVEDLGAWYRAADLFVSPILVAGGLLQKVLDALGTGTPVVATSVSNHGISATPGEHLIVADDPEPFAQAVIALLGDPERRRALGEAGRAFALDRYDPDVTLGRWERALRELVR